VDGGAIKQLPVSVNAAGQKLILSRSFWKGPHAIYMWAIRFDSPESLERYLSFRRKSDGRWQAPLDITSGMPSSLSDHWYRKGLVLATIYPNFHSEMVRRQPSLQKASGLPQADYERLLRFVLKRL